MLVQTLLHLMLKAEIFNLSLAEAYLLVLTIRKFMHIQQQKKIRHIQFHMVLLLYPLTALHIANNLKGYIYLTH